MRCVLNSRPDSLWWVLAGGLGVASVGVAESEGMVAAGGVARVMMGVVVVDTGGAGDVSTGGVSVAVVSSDSDATVQ